MGMFPKKRINGECKEEVKEGNMARRKERDAVVFLNEQMKLAGEVLSEWERGRLFESLRAYSIEGVEPDLTAESRLYRSIFSMMKSAQDKAIAAYEETCERNKRSAMKRGLQLAARATSCSAGSQSNLIESNLIKSNRIESNEKAPSGDPSLKGQEVKGVPGVVWA